MDRDNACLGLSSNRNQKLFTMAGFDEKFANSRLRFSYGYDPVAAVVSLKDMSIWFFTEMQMIDQTTYFTPSRHKGLY